MEKNPNFPDLGSDIPPGKIDKITTKIVKSAQRQAQDVISGELDYMQDPPPADIKPQVKAEYSDRYSERTAASTYYFFMNTRLPPFDDPKVREAVNWGIDKPALARIFAGETAPGCSFLPPGLPGYDEALDVEDCPWGNPNEPPDLEKARQMIKDAGVDGMEVTVYGNNDDPTDKVTAAYADMLNKMGFNATPKIVDGGVYFQTIGSAKTKAQTGFLNWFQDFPHPKNFFFLVDGKSIQPTNSQNPGNVDDPGDHQGHRRAEPGAGDHGRGGRRVGRAQPASSSSAPGSRPTATGSSRRSSRSAWTSRTACASIRCTSTTTRAGA